MNKINAGHAPVLSVRYLIEIDNTRADKRMTQQEAADRAGFDRATWSRIVGGRARPERTVPRPYFDTVAIMAHSVGLTFALVPVNGIEPAAAPMPRRVMYSTAGRPLGPGYERVQDASEDGKALMARLRTIRRAVGISFKAMAKRLHMAEWRLTGIEHGKRDPRLSDVLAHARECGRVVEIVTPEAVPLARLDAAQADAVARLVTSYVAHCIREGKRVPPGLIDAAEALEPTDGVERAA